jgi:hypothetical protein
MNRQQSLNIIWKRLLIIFGLLLAFSAILIVFGEKTIIFAERIRMLALIFIFGNMGSYIGIHKNLVSLKDDEIMEMSTSWINIIVPSFVGGILAIILYLVFLSNILHGDLFPTLVPEQTKDTPQSIGFMIIFKQHGEGIKDYAKLLIWAFIAGYNQKYVVDIIESIKSKT